MIERYFVVGGTEYSFNDDRSGQLVEGCKLTALTTQAVRPGRKGLNALPISAPMGTLAGLELPAVCEFEIELVPKGRNVEVRIVRVVNLTPVDLSQYLTNGKV